MNKMPCHITDGPRYDDNDSGVYVSYCEKCEEDYEYRNVDKCPACARYDTLRRAAISGLEVQIQRLTKSNACDKQDLVDDINRALRFLRTET